jgi:hypothetical protein
LYRRRSRLFSSISRQLAASPVGFLARWVKLPNVAPVQCFHDADPGKHRRASQFDHDHATSSAIAMTTIAMYPNNDTLGERLRLYVKENFHDA